MWLQHEARAQGSDWLALDLSRRDQGETIRPAEVSFISPLTRSMHSPVTHSLGGRMRSRTAVGHGFYPRKCPFGGEGS